MSSEEMFVMVVMTIIASGVAIVVLGLRQRAHQLELAHRELMRCLVREGEVGHALQHYQHLREMLQRELQTEPSPETVRLYERLKRGEQV